MATNQEVMAKLQKIESVIQDQESDITELNRVVDELKDIVQDLDKNMAIQAEKQAHLLSRIDFLQGQIRVLEDQKDKGNDNQRQLIENTLIAILGGIIAYIFNLGGTH